MVVGRWCLLIGLSLLYYLVHCVLLVCCCYVCVALFVFVVSRSLLPFHVVYVVDVVVSCLLLLACLLRCRCLLLCDVVCYVLCVASLFVMRWLLCVVLVIC